MDANPSPAAPEGTGPHSTDVRTASGPPRRPSWFRRHWALTTIVAAALVLFVAFSVYGVLTARGGPDLPPDTIYIGPAIDVDNRTDQEVEVWWFPAHPGPELLGTVAADSIDRVDFRQIPEGTCSPWPVAFRWPDGSELLRMDGGELCTPAEVSVDPPHFAVYPTEEVGDLELRVLEVFDPSQVEALLEDPPERRGVVEDVFEGYVSRPGVWRIQGSLTPDYQNELVSVVPTLANDPDCTANPIVVLRRDGTVHATLDAGWCGVLGDDDLEVTAEGLRPHTPTTEE